MHGEGPAGRPTAPCRWRLIGSLGLRASAWTALIHDQSLGDMALLRPHPKAPKAPKSPQSPGTCLTAAGRLHLLGRVEKSGQSGFGEAQEQARGYRVSRVSKQTPGGCGHELSAKGTQETASPIPWGLLLLWPRPCPWV